jgi:hypothetical protein
MGSLPGTTVGMGATDAVAVGNSAADVFMTSSNLSTIMTTVLMVRMELGLERFTAACLCEAFVREDNRSDGSKRRGGVIKRRSQAATRSPVGAAAGAVRIESQDVIAPHGGPLRLAPALGGLRAQGCANTSLARLQFGKRGWRTGGLVDWRAGWRACCQDARLAAHARHVVELLAR